MSSETSASNPLRDSGFIKYFATACLVLFAGFTLLYYKAVEKNPEAQIENPSTKIATNSDSNCAMTEKPQCQALHDLPPGIIMGKKMYYCDKHGKHLILIILPTYGNTLGMSVSQKLFAQAKVGNDTPCSRCSSYLKRKIYDSVDDLPIGKIVSCTERDCYCGIKTYHLFYRNVSGYTGLNIVGITEELHDKLKDGTRIPIQRPNREY